MSDAANKYEPVIGLEVHAQLLTETKAFCACRAAYGADGNSQTCPVCIGLPGALPVLNRQAVDYAIRMILAVGGTIGRENVFARKNYFYPDLPKGYQISQFDCPVGEGGAVVFNADDMTHSVNLIRIHLEEDAGKSFHPEASGSDPATLVDMNRCGVPLMEIVSEPEIYSPRQASAYMQKLRQTLEYLEICTGNMDEGALRCDANVSLRPIGTTGLGTRTEVKNLNSFRSVERALAFEIERQTAILIEGGVIEQETLLWDEKSQASKPMRSKEESSDYRYFPEPDLLPVSISEAWIDEVRASLPELPNERARRLADDFGIPAYDATVLTDDKAVADYFEATVAVYPHAKRVSNWIMTEVLRVLKEKGAGIGEFSVSPAALGGLMAMIGDGDVSVTAAKDVFSDMLSTGRDAKEIVVEKGLSQISDEAELDALVAEVISAHSNQLADYKSGKTQLLGFFVGQVMKRSQGRANPGQVNRLLQQRLDETSGND